MSLSRVRQHVRRCVAKDGGSPCQSRVRNDRRSKHRPVDGMDFFFSSRRRHTSSYGDWSSDVCSSDLHVVDAQSAEAVAALGLEPADLVVAGEVIEHLDAPGPFLRAMRVLTRPDGRLVLTTPNAYRALNFLAPVSGSELVHPDHTAWHSPRTLRTLLERNGWDVAEVAYYRNPRRRVGRGDGPRP